MQTRIFLYINCTQKDKALYIKMYIYIYIYLFKFHAF
uniref:Uncharacterized protein n=1 Tax=Anguilla anguilla TaxID=7936 RepID=A0A0E9UHZ0_ANGAN